MPKLSVELKRYFWQENRSSEVTLAEMLELAGERIFGFFVRVVIFSLCLTPPCARVFYSLWVCDVFTGNAAYPYSVTFRELR